MAITKEGKEEKKVNYKFPKTIGDCLKRLATLQDKEDEISAQLAPLVQEEKALRDHMINTFKKEQLQGAKGSGRSISLVKTVVPKINDWLAFLTFAKKKGNDDLLQHSVKTDAWRARMDAGKEVPGVETFTNISLRVNKDKGE
jgi:hypothetical protein